MSDRLVRRRQLLSPSLGSLFLSLSLSEARALVCRAACVRARVFRTRLSLELVLLCCLSQTLRSCILQSVWPSSRVWLEVSSQQLIFFSPAASLVCPKADFVNDFFRSKLELNFGPNRNSRFSISAVADFEEEEEDNISSSSSDLFRRQAQLNKKNCKDPKTLEFFFRN